MDDGKDLRLAESVGKAPCLPGDLQALGSRFHGNALGAESQLRADRWGSGAGSFRHVHDVAAARGQAGWLAWADAVVLELMCVARHLLMSGEVTGALVGTWRRGQRRRCTCHRAPARSRLDWRRPSRPIDSWKYLSNNAY